MTTGSIHVDIRLEGHLDQHWTDWFAGLTLTHEPDGTTALRGALEDSSTACWPGCATWVQTSSRPG